MEGGCSDGTVSLLKCLNLQESLSSFIRARDRTDLERPFHSILVRNLQVAYCGESSSSTVATEVLIGVPILYWAREWDYTR